MKSKTYPIIKIENVNKTYKDGTQALENINLEICKGEILALLGPNGAGKTTLISMICGLTSISEGRIEVGGFDVIKNFKKTRSLIGLVPQELTIEQFDNVINGIRFSRGLFGLPNNDQHIEQLLKDLSLWDKKDLPLRSLSGGMKRRVLIAKALCHEPKILFLDEPTAGVDVELRRDMWEIIKRLKSKGTTILLTTHYIEEAEEISDRVAVINHGKVLLIDEKNHLMKKMGKKQLTIELKNPIKKNLETIKKYNLEVLNNGMSLIYIYDTTTERTGITKLLSDLSKEGLILKDLKTNQSSLEEIFVKMLKD